MLVWWSPRVSGLRLESTTCLPGPAARTPLVIYLRASPRVQSPAASGESQVLNILASAPPAFSISSPSTTLATTVAAGQFASYASQLTPGLDYNGTISLTCAGASLGATCRAPASVILNVGAPAVFTVTVVTSGGGLRSKNRFAPIPHTPALPSDFTVAFGTLLFILVLRLYRERGATIPAVGPRASCWKIAYAMAALLIFVPLTFAADGCGGGQTTTPTRQKLL
ncbi:MAG: hypothetical protein QOJ41_3060 [Acidobacteriaceae bacterium]|nr:hypothetical protein [Acidobacteriaceae bacterium]